MPEITGDNDCSEDDMSFSDMEDTEDSDDEHDDGESDTEINSLPHRTSNIDQKKSEGPEEFAQMNNSNLPQSAIEITQPEFKGQVSDTMPDQIIKLLLQLSLTLMTERFADGQPSSTLLV